ncbi:Acg family FMN-binding oxidoreductase [Hyphococcus sp.]|uniref:Acg family FMN-binding oxidoreductase n=1 Tax=Hyphococcus sp. TaxID=2038636 RepID=UPI003CCB9B7B
MTTRRALLFTGTACVAVAGLGAARLLHSDLRPARRPWRDAAEGFSDPRLDALAYAVLAPSPHNRQPWKIRLSGEDEVMLFCDLDRLLPHTDPPNRQIVIGLGAFLELMRQAAAQNGYALELAPFPDGEPYPRLDERPVAHIRFIKKVAIEKDGLFGAALERRTSRIPFDQARPVPAEALTALGDALRPGDGAFGWTRGAEAVAAIKAVCKESWRIETANAATHRESTGLTRIGETEINAAPDGVSLSGPMIETMRLAGVLSRETMNDPASRAYAGTRKFYNGLIDSAMAMGWLSTAGNSRTEQLRAGAGWMRLHLAAARAGLAMQPLSQPLQEFPAMAEMFEEIHRLTGIEPPPGPRHGRVQGLFRFGYAPSPPPAPRWPLSSRIIVDDA